MTRKYIAVQYDDGTQDKLREWCIKNGFNLSMKYGGATQDPKDFDFHTTIFYSSNEVDLPKHEMFGYKLIEKYQAVPLKFELLGENNDVPVLKLEVTGGIAYLRNYYARMGFQDKWEEYKPHISLSYEKRPYDLSKLELPTFKMMFNEVKIEDIKDDV